MISALLKRFQSDSLFKNSVYLMMATASLAFFGFLFWFICARLFTTEEVGLATTLIAATTLISIIAQIGFNAALVRFLPTEEHPKTTVNTAFILVTLAALVAASVFLIILPVVSPKLLFIREHAVVASLFIATCIAMALNTLKDSVFLARRRSHFIFLVNSAFSAARLAFPFAFFAFGAVGIFAATGLSHALGFAIGALALVWSFGYKPSLRFDPDVVRRVWRYSSGNYLASSLNLIPASVLPLIIMENIGAPEAAYFYIAMMIGNLLYVIPFATTRSLFAEGSNEEARFTEHFRSAVKIIIALMLPAIAALLILGGFVLSLFGPEYAAEGATLLRLIALAGLSVSAMSIANAYFQVKKDTGAIVAINFVYAAAVVGLSYALLPFGLSGVGFAWIIGTGAAALTGAVLYRFPFNFTARYKAISYEIWIRYTCAIRYRRARKKGPRRTILFYPDLPKYYYVHYTIAHELGLDMHNNLERPYDLAMSFKDVTLRKADPAEEELLRKGRFINARARDISKEKVERVFSDVFGYGTFLDPRTFEGECVQKSNENAMHDGTVVQCPREPEAGYIYQKLINNQDGDRVADLRVKVVGRNIPLMTYRTRSAFDRFDNTQTSTMVPTDDYLTHNEQRKILRFCEVMGIDFGALDCLRDRDDGKLYIVDANLTTGMPQPGVHLTREEFEVYVQKFAGAFRDAFLTP